MDSNATPPEDANRGQMRAQTFQADFVRGCLSFLTLAILVRGESETLSADKLYNSFIDPILGNRNPDTTSFADIMPELYKKVVEYCNEAVAVSESVENSDRDA